METGEQKFSYLNPQILKQYVPLRVSTYNSWEERQEDFREGKLPSGEMLTQKMPVLSNFSSSRF